MALFDALLAPHSQLTPIKVNINPYAKKDKRVRVQGRYFLHLGQAKFKGRKGNWDLGSCSIYFVPLLIKIRDGEGVRLWWYNMVA